VSAPCGCESVLYHRTSCRLVHGRRSGRTRALVIVESPYAGDVENNMRYLRAAIRDCLLRGEAPFASHALYTQPGVLVDDDPVDRSLGIAAGLDWATVADATVVYEDLGISRGMQLGIDHAEKLGRPVLYRRLPAWTPAAREASCG
jgi:hypothetical protein